MNILQIIYEHLLNQNWNGADEMEKDKYGCWLETRYSRWETMRCQPLFVIVNTSLHISKDPSEVCVSESVASISGLGSQDLQQKIMYAKLKSLNSALKKKKFQLAGLAHLAPPKPVS